MAKERPFLASLNGGEVSPLSLGRIDLARMRYTAEEMTNFIPRVIGPMAMRPGLAYLGGTAGNAQIKQLPFVFSADDTAMVELGDQTMQVMVDDVPITRPAVATQITNGDFSSAVGWTLTNTGGSAFAEPRSEIAGGVLTMNNWVRGGTMIVKRSTTVAAPDLNVEHGLRIVVTRGPVRFRCGSSDGGDEYIAESELGTGTYSLAFTPTASPFWVQFSSEVERDTVVDSIQVEAAGVMTLPTPWPTADIRKCRAEQSGDVIFVANTSRLYQTRRIERRATRSWGVALHENLDGPFKGKTADVGLSIVSSGISGGPLTIQSTKPFFKPTQVGGLFRLFAARTVVISEVASDDQWSDPIRITGRGAAERGFLWATTGTWVGTLRLQVSYDEGETWTNTEISRATNGTNPSIVVGENNQIVHIRVGFASAGHTSGTARNSLVYEGGGGWGIVRVLSYISPTQVSTDVIKPLNLGVSGNTTEWEEGKFSPLNGWPSGLGFFDGRLWLGDNDQVMGSVSDNFSSLDIETEGDSGPIIRSIATGPVDRVLWMLPLGRLIVGTSGSEAVPRSTSFDEVMTPDNFSIKDASNYGSADVAAVKVDRTGIYIEKSGKRAYVLSYSIDDQDYGSNELTKYHPTILGTGNVSCIGIAVQRQPDTRVWFTLSDGTAIGLVYEPKEDVISWFRFETDGDVEDIAVLPNNQASDVYFIVNRGGNRFREKLAYDTNAWGGADNYMADSYVTADLVASNVVPGIAHLEGETVVAWVAGAPLLNGDDPRTFVVGGGSITLPQSYTGKAIVGLPYTGRWKSTKLAYGAQMGTAVSQMKQLKDFAAVLYKTHLRALKYGTDFDHMRYYSREIAGKIVPADTFLESYDATPLDIDGSWNTDQRLCLEARAPMPATILGLAGAVLTHETG